jgi:hypothetical protein
MKIKEVTNPEEQLGLLRVIIDNTWSAIKQQADAQARQKAAQPTPSQRPSRLRHKSQHHMPQCQSPYQNQSRYISQSRKITPSPYQIPKTVSHLRRAGQA